MLKSLQQNNNTKEFAIVASFARSFDNSHKENNRIHLISSICLLSENELTKFKDFLRKKTHFIMEENFYIFIVQPNKIDRVVAQIDNVFIINISIEELISHLGFTKKSDLLFENIFGRLDSQFKDFDSISQNSIFVFLNQMWSNIVLNFKINKVDISGGSISKRHILQTVDTGLAINLNYILEDFNTIQQVVYNSLRNPILSSSIPLKFYQEILNRWVDINKLKIKDITQITSENKNSIIFPEKENLNLEKVFAYEELFLSNLNFAIKMLIEDIKESITEELSDLKTKGSKYLSEKNSLLYNKEKFEGIDKTSTRYMSNKEKKKFKKEKSRIKQMNIPKELNILDSQITDLEDKIEKFSILIDSKQSELTNFIDKNQEYTLLDLNILHTKKNIKNNNLPFVKNTKTFKEKKSILNSKNDIFKNGFRSYGTLNHKNYSTKAVIEKKNFEINSPIYIELQRIINNSSLDEDTQMKIEQFLNNQGALLLKTRMEQKLDINYNKINPYVLEYLKKSIEELSSLINNYRINIDNNSNINSENVESILMNSLPNDVIISHLLGRFLRIISNHNLSNKNTNCTELASDLGQSLLFCFYNEKYEEWIKNNCDGLLNIKKYNELNQKNKEKDKQTYKEWLEDQKEFYRKNFSLSKFINEKYSHFKNSVTNTVLIQIGLKLLNFLEEVNLIHSDIYTLSKDHKIHVYVANDNIVEDIGKSLNLLNISSKIPMIVPPKPYGSEKGKDVLGGFLLNDKMFIDPLIIKNTELKEQSNIIDKNIIYSVINRLSSVGYKINIPVLEFILENRSEYGLFTDPNFTHPLEFKKNNKGKLTLYEKKILDAFLSKKQLEMNILGLSLIFKNVPAFYIPVRIDNRGRIYCMVDYLNYQGIELAKSLLLFSKAEKIYKYDKQSIDYLKIFGANCFGNGIDKKSYNDRVEWVNTHEEDILNFRNGILIKQADSKLLFIAFCFEYLNYHNSLIYNETFYYSNFPIQLDATCNGYQHLSLLTGDDSLAGHLNLISGDENSVPKDFYSFVALKMKEYLQQYLSEEKQKLSHLNEKKFKSEIISEDEYKKIVLNIESCKKLLKLNINRAILKLPIMVKPYNATILTMVDYLKDNLNKTVIYKNIESNLDNSKEYKKIDKVFYTQKSNNLINLENKDLILFIQIMEKIIYNEFPKLKELNLYLAKIAEICSKLNITITWVLPTGLNVNQHYIDSEAIRLRPFKYRKNSYTIKIHNNITNKNKQIKALMPNLIHSLDAASLSLIIEMFYQENLEESKRINFFSIHDCFAVTANNIADLIKIIKLIYIKIYSDDIYLKRFDNGIINSIKLQFGNKAFNDETKMIKVDEKIFKYPDVNLVISGQIKAHKIMNAHSIIN